MLTSKAAILQQSHQNLLIADIDIPEKLLDRQVLVKISYSSICGSQLGEIDAIKGPDKFLPHLLGHEGVGIVLDVGPEVSRIKIGERVILHWMKNNEPDATNPKYFLENTEINAGQIATFTDYAIISENRLTVVKTDIENVQLAFLGCGALTAYGVLTNDLQVNRSENILILGAGGIGVITLLMAQALGFTNNFITDKNLSKMKFIGDISKAGTLQIEDLGESLSKYNNIIDTTGNVKIIEKAYEALEDTGKLCLVGVTPLNEKITINPMPLHYGKSLIGSFGGSVNPLQDINEITRMITNGAFKPELACSTVTTLSQLNNTIGLLRGGKVLGKILIQLS